jgi:BA14K-like protein
MSTTLRMKRKGLLAAAILGLAHTAASAAPQGAAVAAAIKDNAGSRLAIEQVQLSPQAQRNRDNRRAVGTAVGIGLAAGALGAILGSGGAAARPVYDERPVYRERRPVYVEQDDDYYVDSRRPYRRTQPVYVAPPPPPPRVRSVRGGDVEYCLSRYRSYDPRTGTYIDYNGRERFCP